MKSSLVLCLGFLIAISSACGKKEEKKEAGKAEQKHEMTAMPPVTQELPPGHPTMGGQNGGAKREVRVPPDVKERWKTVSIKFIDKEKKKEKALTLDVGKETSIPDTKLAIKVEAFLPNYTIFDEYITSKNNEPENAAVLVELLEGGKGVSKGWVFERLSDFNSYKNDKYDIVLMPMLRDKRLDVNFLQDIIGQASSLTVKQDA
ncbi:MAG: hypothetical protein HZB79_08880 [Deltaproteobacteria bacterium]|nr:hypothetical protein [Deltaproteobacteria bacterium]